MRRQIRESTVTLKYVNTIRRNGKVYRYLRAPGAPSVRLPNIDDPRFLEAYTAALKAVPQRAAPGTIAATVEACLRSERAKGLSAPYRAALRRHMDAIRGQAQDARLGHLRPEHVRADVSALPGSVALSRLKAWRFLCGWAVDSGLLSTDPTAGVKVALPEAEGHAPWTADEIERFRTRWPVGTAPRACFEVLHWTGARIGDAVALGPGMVGRDGVLAYRQSKTRGMAYVPWSCPLPAYASGMATDRAEAHRAIEPLAGHMTFLATAQGRARSSKALGNMIREAAREAGVEKSAHGLRKTRAVALAEAGATTHQIAAWTGHETLKEVAHYTEQADRRRAVMGTEQDRNPTNTPDPDCKTGAAS